jgi:phosphatidate cytidylyltransferase
MLLQRIVTAFLLLAGFLGAMFLAGRVGWMLTCALFVLGGAWEWARLSGWSARASAAWLLACVVAMAGVAGVDAAWLDASLFGAALAYWLVAAPWWIFRERAWPHPAWRAVAGALVLLPAWWALVRLHDIGAVFLLGLMAVIWISDTAAYFAGRAFGRRKLAPRISPGKTWEGLLGALVATAAYALALDAVGGAWREQFDVSLPLLVVLVWALVLLGVLGDLFESWIKRVAGVKDSGTLLPGHGGVLDRIDALTPALPAAALALQFLSR